MIFETHAHYDDDKFNEDRKELLESLQDNGIEYVVDIGASIESTKKALALSKAYDFIYAAAGVHPSDIECLNEESFGWLCDTIRAEKQSVGGKIVAVGEIGLDYYWDKEAEVRRQQKVWFERQAELAREEKLPMVIHSRDAAADTLDMMKGMKAGDIGGVIHCFSYSVEMAREYLNMGYYLGIGGVVTFNNAKVLKEVVKYAPLSQLVLETDSPYLSPKRGNRNSSLNLPLVAKTIAEIKNESYDSVVAATYENAKNLYKIGKH